MKNFHSSREQEKARAAFIVIFHAHKCHLLWSLAVRVLKIFRRGVGENIPVHSAQKCKDRHIGEDSKYVVQDSLMPIEARDELRRHLVKEIRKYCILAVHGHVSRMFHESFYLSRGLPRYQNVEKMQKYQDDLKNSKAGIEGTVIITKQEKQQVGEK